MSIVPIKVYGEDVLRQIASPIENINQDIVTLVDRLKETMVSAKGLGLAANQIGVPLRAFAIDMTHFDVLAEPEVLINPEVVDLGTSIINGEEGCLSFPGLFQLIDRPEKLSLKYLDINGEEKFLDAEGLKARVMLHEIDHLDGILFIDKLNAGQRLFLKGKLKKIKAGETV